MAKVTRLSVALPDVRRTILVPLEGVPRRLTHVLRGADILLNTRCGERSLCRGCEVDLVSGHVVDLSTAAQEAVVSAPAVIRACQCGLAGDTPVALRIPARSLLGHRPQVVSSFTLKVGRADNALWRSVPIRAASLADAAQDVARALAEQLQAEDRIQCPPEVAAQISRQAANGDVQVALEYDGQHWQVTETTRAAPARRVGAAIDIGTTTVVVLLVDLERGGVLAEGSAFNRQMHLGDDVVTRITLCDTDPTMRARLQAALLQDTLTPLLADVLRRADRSYADLACITAAGNTTMLHLLVGEDPGPMGTAPFRPAFLEHKRIRWSTLQPLTPTGASPAASVAEGRDPVDSHTPPTGGAAGPWLHVLPSAAAYIGADVCAGVLASGLVYDAGPSLLVDVGTNGEIVLKHDDCLRACATAAGPAFEGGGLSCGVRASKGAISHVRFTSDPLTVHTEVIGGSTALGVCGSAYIDILGEGRRCGLLNRNGRLGKDTVPPGVERMLIIDGSGRALRLATGNDGQAVSVSEADIARLLQAKAAIAAGILTLLAQFDLTPEDIRTLYLAGGFGLHVDPANAIACGLLPGFQPE